MRLGLARATVRLAVRALGIVTLLLVVGCGGKAVYVRSDGVQTAARQAYLDGLVELEAGNYQEAIRYFQQVAASPSYFRYTALASLRVADALFYQEQYARAVEAYQGFIKRFAGNPNIPYAQFRVAECHFRRIPGDWWFMPAAYEKDLSSTRAAYDALSRFLTRYPRHRFAPQADRMRGFAAKRLYEFEAYAADFYEGRDRPRGVAQRLEAALTKFPEQATSEETYLRLARAYADAGDPKGTRSALQRYLVSFPDGARSAEVQSWLDTLGPAPSEGGDEGTAGPSTGGDDDGEDPVDREDPDDGEDPDASDDAAADPGGAAATPGEEDEDE